MRRALATTMLLAGCAGAAAPHAPKVTQVASEAQVCLDRASLRAGQTLRFHRHVCAYVPPKNLVRQCHDEPIATAEVLRLVGERCVIVLSPAAGALQPGDEIEIAYRD
jgi:hypothetical protein